MSLLCLFFDKLSRKSFRPAFVVAALAFTACNKSNVTPTKLHHVYVAGTDLFNASYWKDTLEVKPDTNGTPSRATSIFVSGGDVYVSGFDGTAAKYWKNDTAVVLASAGWTNSIFVSGKDVYVSGDMAGSSGIVGAYWKNGTPVTLPNAYEAKGIYVSGSDVYVAGTERPSLFIAKYWKNGAEVNLTDGSHDADARSIFVSNGDVYVAGMETDNTNNPDHIYFSVAKYWKNGQAVTLSDGSFPAEAYSIFVSGSDIYVAGYETTPDPLHIGNGNHVAKYWKNGVGVNLTDGASSCEANSIYVLDKDVYVAGYELGQAKYWKNGTPVNLSSQGFLGEAYSIFVN
jgi:hypothetical protein